MQDAISLNAIAMWFVWGFFMGAGWTFASWLIGRLLARV